MMADMPVRVSCPGRPDLAVVIDDALWSDLQHTLRWSVVPTPLLPQRLIQDFTLAGLVTRDVHPDLDLVVAEALRQEDPLLIEVVSG